MGLELTDKKAKILLGVLRANRPTDVKSLSLRLKKRGDKIHMNYVRRVVDELGKENLIDVEILGRGFRRISPKDDIETFKRLAHLFLISPHKFEFLGLPYAKDKLTGEFLNSLATEFWAKYGEAIKEASDEILNNLKSQTEYLGILEPFREAIKTLPPKVTVNLLDIIKNSPFALWVLMFPEEATVEIKKQVILTPGNTVSTSALFWCSVYNVNLMMTSNTGRPLSMMLPLTSSAHVKTRIKQYEAYYNSKGVAIAKTILSAKIQNQIALLEKHGFDSYKLDYLSEKLSKIDEEKIDDIRPKLMGIESRCSKVYFGHFKTLFPDFLQTSKRMKHNAEDPLNNLLNLGYEVLKGEVYRGVMYAHLDPYLGYLHSIQFAKPSLVCDIQEVFRSLIDEFLMGYGQRLSEGDFENRNGRMFLKQKESYKLIKAVNKLFDKRIEHQRIKKYGGHSKIRTAIREEPIKLAQYLRGEKGRYEPVLLRR